MVRILDNDECSKYLVEGFSILQLALLVLGAVRLEYACESTVELAEDKAKYLKEPNRENAFKIFGKALEAGILFFVFEYALPRVIKGIKVTFGKLKDFITRKWGRGVEIKISEPKP